MLSDSRHAYITSSGSFLPGSPVGNDQIEEILGFVHGRPSRLRKRILKSNGIVFRHYTMDSKQRSTYHNADLATMACRNCLEQSEIDDSSLDMLACASTQGDLPLPGMASAVQANLGVGPLGILTTHGVCSAGVMAWKGSVNQVRLGEKSAMITESELELKPEAQEVLLFE